MLLVSEQVNVLGRPTDDPVREQCVTAAQGEPKARSRSQGNRRDPGMQITDRHQPDPAAAARRTG